MIDDVPEVARIYVITKPGELPEAGEFARAARLSYLRGFYAKEMCTRSVGNCAIRVAHNEIKSDGFTNNVDEYRLECDPDCPLLPDGVLRDA